MKNCHNTSAVVHSVASHKYQIFFVRIVTRWNNARFVLRVEWEDFPASRSVGSGYSEKAAQERWLQCSEGRATYWLSVSRWLPRYRVLPKTIISQRPVRFGASARQGNIMDCAPTVHELLWVPLRVHRATNVRVWKLAPTGELMDADFTSFKCAVLKHCSVYDFIPGTYSQATVAVSARKGPSLELTAILEHKLPCWSLY